MIICIQGGAEFSEKCREMDAYFLSLVPDLEITIFPGASEHERSAALTSENAIGYFASLGRKARRIKDLTDAQVLVLPGGSPRLLWRASCLIETFLLGSRQSGGQVRVPWCWQQTPICRIEESRWLGWGSSLAEYSRTHLVSI